MRRKLRRFLNGEGGATAIEYALVAALFAIASISAARAFGDNATGMYTQIAEAMEGATGGAGGEDGGGGDGGGGEG